MPTKDDIQRLIFTEAQRQGVNPQTLLNLARQESGYDQGARSSKGAIGVMQLMPATARQLQVNPYDLRENITGGVRYFKQQLRRFDGNERLAAAAYNAGPGAVEKHGGVPPYKETRNYVAAIFRPATAEAGTLPPPLRIPEGVVPSGGTTGRTLPPPLQAPTQEATRGEVEVLSSGPPGTAAAQGAVPTEDPLAQAPSPVQALLGAIRGEQRLPFQAPATPAPPTTTFGAMAAKKYPGPTGVGANIGEMVGQAAGARLPIPGSTAIGGMVGALAGLTAETLLREQRLPTRTEVGTEALLTGAMEVGETVLKSVGRRQLARTQAGRIARGADALERMETGIGTVFPHVTRPEAARMFDLVRQAGVNVVVEPITDHLRQLDPQLQRRVLNVLRNLPAQATQIEQFGPRVARLFENLLTTPGASSAMDLGAMQQMRSGIRQEMERHVTDTATRDALGALLRVVDATGATGRAIGANAPAARQLLAQARHQYYLLNVAEDLGELATRHSSVTSGGRNALWHFDLQGFERELGRNTSRLAQEVNTALDHVPQARARFNQVIDTIRRIDFPFRSDITVGADTSGIFRLPLAGQLAREFADVALHPAAFERFRAFVTTGRGKITSNQWALVLGVARRGLQANAAGGAPEQTAPGPSILRPATLSAP